jgi:hypothetical protein
MLIILFTEFLRFPVIIFSQCFAFGHKIQIWQAMEIQIYQVYKWRRFVFIEWHWRELIMANPFGTKLMSVYSTAACADLGLVLDRPWCARPAGELVFGRLPRACVRSRALGWG